MGKVSWYVGVGGVAVNVIVLLTLIFVGAMTGTSEKTTEKTTEKKAAEVSKQRVKYLNSLRFGEQVYIESGFWEGCTAYLNNRNSLYKFKANVNCPTVSGNIIIIDPDKVTSGDVDARTFSDYIKKFGVENEMP